MKNEKQVSNVVGVLKYYLSYNSRKYGYFYCSNLYGDQMKPKLLTNEYILGWVLMLTSMYLESEGRIASSIVFSLAGIVILTVDLVKKVKYVNQLRKEIKVKVEKDKDKKE